MIKNLLDQKKMEALCVLNFFEYWLLLVKIKGKTKTISIHVMRAFHEKISVQVSKSTRELLMNRLELSKWLERILWLIKDKNNS